MPGHFRWPAPVVCDVTNPTTGHLNLTRHQQSAHQKAKHSNPGHPVMRLPSQGKLPTRRLHTMLHIGVHRVEEEPTQRTLVH